MDRLHKPRAFTGRLGSQLLVGGVAFAVYCQSYGFDFVYDDRMQIVANPWIRSWQYMPRYFTSHVWGFLNNASAGSYWRPAFLLWLRFNYALFHLNPAPWHLAAAFVHAIVAVLALEFTRKLSRDRFVPIAAALLFAVHPATIESVAWISGITDALMAAWLLAALLLYWNSAGTSGSSLEAASLACFAMALLSKETAIVAPAIVATIAYLYRTPEQAEIRKRASIAIREALPYVSTVGVYLFARLTAMHTLYGVPRNSYSAVLYSAPSFFVFYMRHLIVPTGLSACYDIKPLLRFTMDGFLVPGLMLAAVVLAAARLLRYLGRTDVRQAKAAAVALVLMGVPLLPAFYVRGLPEFDAAHTRYLYFPCIGFAMLVGVALAQFRRVHRTIPMVSVGLIVAVLASATSVQERFWADGVSLFTRAVEIAPTNPVAQCALASEFGNQGLLDAAIEHLQLAHQINADYWDPYRNLGVAYLDKGDLHLSEEYLKRAVEMRPDRADALQILATVQLNENKLDEAEQSIRRAIQINPAAQGFHYTLGFVLQERGDRAGAIQAYRQELQVSPDHPDTLQHLQQLEQAR